FSESCIWAFLQSYCRANLECSTHECTGQLLHVICYLSGKVHTMHFKKSYLLCCLLIYAAIAKGNFFPHRLSCEHKIAPYGIENTKPLMGWWISATERAVAQSAWQIL